MLLLLFLRSGFFFGASLVVRGGSLIAMLSSDKSDYSYFMPVWLLYAEPKYGELFISLS